MAVSLTLDNGLPNCQGVQRRKRSMANCIEGTPNRATDYYSARRITLEVLRQVEAGVRRQRKKSEGEDDNDDGENRKKRPKHQLYSFNLDINATSPTSEKSVCNHGQSRRVQ